LWGPRDFYKSAYYLESAVAFCSEIGYFGCPDPESVREFISPASVWPPTNREWRLHGVSPFPDQPDHEYRVPLMLAQVERLFGVVPDNLEDFSAASQISQAEALKFFVDRFRSKKWQTTGIIWWNLLDGWPQISDAVVDYFFRKKRAFDVLRAAQAEITVIVDEPGGGRSEILLSNDTRADHEVRVVVRDRTRSGVTLLDVTEIAAADEVTVLGEMDVPDGQGLLDLCCWYAGKTWTGHYMYGTPPFELDEVVTWLTRLDPAVGRLPAGVTRDRAST